MEVKVGMDSATQFYYYSQDNIHENEILLASNTPKKRAGRKKFKETRHPLYRGVRERNNKWACELRDPNDQKRIWLGTYPTPEMAARAHDVGALALKGHMACLNFADSVWKLQIPTSKDAKDIRKAAMEAAEAFRPVNNEIMYTNVNMEDNASTSSLVQHEPDCYFQNMSGYYMNYDTDNNMAPPEGMSFSPQTYFDRTNLNYWDNMESEAEVELWSY